MPALTTPAASDLENIGFTLEQAITWCAKCFRIGFKDLESEDAEAARRAALALKKGEAAVAVHLNLTRGEAYFTLHLYGDDDDTEIPLFKTGFAPPELLN